jgi:heat shock protein 4
MWQNSQHSLTDPALVPVSLCPDSICCAAGLQQSDIATVEVLGGSTRVPAVFKLIERVFGVTPSRTLNAKEVVCRGAALQCAMISPLIKVRGCFCRHTGQGALLWVS